MQTISETVGYYRVDSKTSNNDKAKFSQQARGQSK